MKVLDLSLTRSSSRVITSWLNGYMELVWSDSTLGNTKVVVLAFNAVFCVTEGSCCRKTIEVRVLQTGMCNSHWNSSRMRQRTRGEVCEVEVKVRVSNCLQLEQPQTLCHEVLQLAQSNSYSSQSSLNMLTRVHQTHFSINPCCCEANVYVSSVQSSSVLLGRFSRHG